MFQENLEPWLVRGIASFQVGKNNAINHFFKFIFWSLQWRAQLTVLGISCTYQAHS